MLNSAETMQLTKTDFVRFLQCSKSFWVFKKDREKYPEGELSVFLRKLSIEGYEVERWFKSSFEEDVHIEFQKEFVSDDGLYARTDGFELTQKGEAILYEVKSSTEIKTGEGQDHIKDACFQTIAAERSGQGVDRVILVHLNKEYVRRGEIEPKQLLSLIDITGDVRAIYKETESEIGSALALLRKDHIEHRGCECIYKSRGNHCDTFELLNPLVPKKSIYSLPRLSALKRRDLLESGIVALTDIGEKFELSDIQLRVLKSAQIDAPIINRQKIAARLKSFKFPLYFFDYEAYGSAIPVCDHVSPHQQFPVQYSLHILQEDGSIEHREYLNRKPEIAAEIAEHLKADIGDQGSIVCWHASYEKSQNRKLMKWFPEHKEFFEDINARIVDLEDFFKRDYVDIKFDGSTSIKKVLPVTCPHLGYEDLSVQDGAAAMEAWKKMILAAGEEADRRAKDLLAYCHMDTLAMVDIYKFLKAKIN